ncbi:MAG: bifunctional phosphoribosylaminoimidazolecarboxamide formyltransferase/IMP cyclohydrolase [Rhizobiales bacterium NRL2]|jgi:phosphoribosylaminoimidazolecarboxamide formyltransferase/IMP cyclohydrolase|nr:MAG: bifunctional phosphoribosylaminoimidazolecarboxamide formyltransferase/IMP cyclohydrolase [Rhizobiales bacterium NRL2]
MTDTTFAPKRALISVSDKSGLDRLGQFLKSKGVEILSTGGTARALADMGCDVTEVSDHTGSPEMMDGRVKTLHPKIHGGILGLRDAESHVKAMKDHDIAPIDLVIINLYPFEQTVAAGADRTTAIENIDIGGPAMIRSAAKNHRFVAIVTDPADYDGLMEQWRNEGGLTLAFREHLAAKAFARTGAYDSAITAWFAGQSDEMPGRFAVSAGPAQPLRYGENPHQMAAFYPTGDLRPGVASARQLQGKALSYNNLNDTDAAYELVAEFDARDAAAVAIIKHANPCGVATGASAAEAYERALACDPVSAFGGIIALNRPLEADAAAKITEIFTEVIIAPGASEEAIEIVAKKKNLRLLLTDGLPDPTAPGLAYKALAGGVLAQSRDNGRVTKSGLEIVTKRAPSDAEMADMIFAFRVAKHVKSNAIVYVRGQRTVGIGAGQMSRVDSARIAARKAEDAREAAGDAESWTRGSVVASDAFFPFADGLLAAVEAGATAVIQPGGSVRDNEVIAAADEAGLAMAFTGMRHFRH